MHSSCFCKTRGNGSLWRSSHRLRRDRSSRRVQALLFARDLNAHWRLGLPSPLLRFKEPLQGPVKLFLSCLLECRRAAALTAALA
jgi:hypothetical protein